MSRPGERRRRPPGLRAFLALTAALYAVPCGVGIPVLPFAAARCLRACVAAAGRGERPASLTAGVLGVVVATAHRSLAALFTLAAVQLAALDPWAAVPVAVLVSAASALALAPVAHAPLAAAEGAAAVAALTPAPRLALAALVPAGMVLGLVEGLAVAGLAVEAGGRPLAALAPWFLVPLALAATSGIAALRLARWRPPLPPPSRARAVLAAVGLLAIVALGAGALGVALVPRPLAPVPVDVRERLLASLEAPSRGGPRWVHVEPGHGDLPLGLPLRVRWPGDQLLVAAWDGGGVGPIATGFVGAPSSDRWVVVEAGQGGEAIRLTAVDRARGAWGTVTVDRGGIRLDDGPVPRLAAAGLAGPWLLAGLAGLLALVWIGAATYRSDPGH
ncbi:MAG: hypothetical protein ACFCGT_03325 [Sandaracinaceae bacterium]